MEKLFLQPSFDYGIQKHKYFNNLDENIFEDLNLIEEDAWDMIIDKIFIEHRNYFKRGNWKLDLDVLNDTGDIDVTLGFRMSIKDGISERFNDVHKDEKNKIRKMFLQQCEGISSLFKNTTQS